MCEETYYNFSNINHRTKKGLEKETHFLIARLNIILPILIGRLNIKFLASYLAYIDKMIVKILLRDRSRISSKL